MVKNPPSNTRGMGLIPGWETEILYALEQLSPVLQLERSPCATMTQNDQKKKKECCLLLFFNNFVYLFIFGCAESSLLCGLFLVWRGGLPSSLSVQASHCSGFSCCGERALGCSGFSSLANGLSSCSSQAQWLWHTGLVAL